MVLDKALAAFPLPLPELFVPPPNELTEPYSVLLRLNLRDTQEWIGAFVLALAIIAISLI